MGLARHALLAWLCWVGAALAQVGQAVPPAPTVYPNDVPSAAVFFPAGGPLERFTGRPGAWYALYRLPMYPGRPYELLIGHAGDPARLRAYALDDHPFGKVNVKLEIALRRVETWGADQQMPTYAASVSTPFDTANFGFFLLLEWDPPTAHGKPLPLLLQTLAVVENPYSPPKWWFMQRREFDRPPESPLQSRRREFERPLESPLQSQQRRMTQELPLPSKAWGH
jgi:hypothetical protein